MKASIRPSSSAKIDAVSHRMAPKPILSPNRMNTDAPCWSLMSEYTSDIGSSEMYVPKEKAMGSLGS